MKAVKRITSMILSVCMLLGLVFVPTQAQQVSANGGGHRGNAYNNAVTAIKTPTTAEGAGLLWAQKLGNYAGPPMYANGSVYTYWENKIYKLNKNNGTVEATGTIVLDPNNSWAQAFGYTYFPVTYGDGKVYVGIAGGKVQAFNADTLESEWVYTNADADSKTDAYSPITYEDGKIYTGFYKGYGSSAPTAFVCVSTKDGKEVWSTTDDGSFNWDGAAVAGNYVVYGNGNGNLISRNKTTGELVETQNVSSAEIKASVTYDNGKIYAITGDAKLIVADIDASSGKFSNMKQIDCSQYGPNSTSTPVVYNGIVYVGVGKWGSGKVIAVNPAEEKVLWSVNEPSYPQGSILLSNAYENEGYLYLYVTYNGRPGGINVVKVKADGSEAEGYELYNAAGYEQFCLSSVVVDEEGTLYYKNDSGNVIAVAKADKLDDKVKAVEVEKIITDLPAEAKITLDDEKAITEARESYEALTEKQKAFISTEVVQTLEAAEAKINLLKTEKALGELPSASKVTLENEKKIASVRKQYDSLTRAQKKELSSEDVMNLFDAEKKIAQLKDEAAKEVSAKDAQAAEKVEKQIEAIGTVTLSKVDTVKAVKAEYDKLTKVQKNLISVEAVVTLREAIAESNKYVKDTKTNAYYKVENNTAAYIKPITAKSSEVIPAQITVVGHTYKVTIIRAKAFSKNTTVTRVVIGKNVSKIGKEAFYGCKNLKKIQVKSKKLSSKNVGSNAFKEISKNAKMSVPKSKVKAYAKWVKIKGSRSIKVTK